MDPNRSPDLARTTLQLLALAALIGTSLWIVRPFLVALIWAATVAIATWPLLLYAQSWFGGRRGLAVALMTVVLLLILVVPLYFAITTITGNVGLITEWSKSIATLIRSQPPAWVQALPLVGARLATSWRKLATAGPDEITAHFAPFAHDRGDSVCERRDGGPRYAAFANRLAGPAGEKAMHLAAQAIRGVALGVVVTAILQSILAGVGLAVAGVPFAAF